MLAAFLFPMLNFLTQLTRQTKKPLLDGLSKGSRKFLEGGERQTTDRIHQSLYRHFRAEVYPGDV
jgi:hypothetical protein